MPSILYAQWKGWMTVVGGEGMWSLMRGCDSGCGEGDGRIVEW